MEIYITILIQVLLVIHVLKSGKNRYWIWMLLLLPFIGAIAYLVIEIIPEFAGSVTGQKTIRNVKATIDPGGQLRRHELAWQQSPNADNARRYAAALLDASEHEKADEILAQALSGFFSTEPNLMLLRARARFESGDANGAVGVLEQLQDANPDFRSAEGHLLYARALEQDGRTNEAITEFRSVSGYYPGAEARYRLAAALNSAGQHDESKSEFEHMLNDAKLAPAHFRKSQAHWLKLARKALKEL